MTDITTQAARAVQGVNPARPAINAPTNATFKTTDTTDTKLLINWEWQKTFIAVNNRILKNCWME